MIDAAIPDGGLSGSIAMAIKFTAESFLELVKRSRLVSPDQLQRVLAEAKAAGVNIEDSREIANTLVEQNGLTRWQADKLLQGKHKGFFLGKYRLLSLLGKGGMGSVYLAEHTLMRRRCAIKVLPAKRVHDSSYLGRFHREAQAVAALDHVNIVRAYDVDKENEGDAEIHFLVMEYVNGRSMLEIVVQDGPVGYVQAADYVRQASDGLTHAHQAGMVHRDIKPGNLLVDTNGVVKILDLGLARFFSGEHADEEESLTVAHDEKVLGTADYLAPEQAIDSHSVDSRADIYSLGCTAYFLLSGHPPFTEGTLAQRLMAHQTKEPPPLESECPGIPVDFLAIIKRMMAKSLDERYQTADEVNEALKTWLLKNADDDWRLRNSAIIGSDSSTTHGQATPSLKNLNESKATAEPAVTETAAVKPAAVSPVAAAETQPLPTATASPTANVDGADDNLAAFLTNLDAPAPPPAIDTSSSTTANNNAQSETRKQAAVTTPVAAAAVPIEARPLDAIPAEATPPKATPVQAVPVAAKPVVAQPVDAKPVVAEPAVASPAVAAAIPVAEAVPFAEVEPATPAAIPERSFARRAKRRRSGRSNSDMFRPLINLSKNKQVRVGMAAVAGVVLLGAIVSFIEIDWSFAFFAGSGDKKTNQEVAADSSDDSQADDTTPDSSTDSGSPPKALGEGIVEVGPAAKFKTIAAALKHARDNYEPRRRKSQLVIQVAGGKTYSERIVVDGSYPAGIRIVAKEGARPVLTSTDNQPLIKLDGVERFSIEGFDLNAQGKSTAIELAGYLTDCHLKDLKLSGFTGTGILANGAVGVGVYDQEIRLEHIELHAAGPKAVGMRFQQGTSDTSQVKVTDCRFHGPLLVGILLQNSPTFIAVRRSIFAEAKTGIKFDGSNMRLSNITVGNCTFFKLDRGIVFTSLPSTASHSLKITRNVFSGLKGLDIVVENEFDSKTMFTMFSAAGRATGWNWTSRAKPETPIDGEFDIFSNGGQMGAKIDFVSVDAGSERFLAPVAGEPWARVAAEDPKTDLKSYAGAVGP
jgi:serine/threonine-protein kinase